MIVLFSGIFCLKNAKKIVKYQIKYRFFIFLVSGIIFYALAQLIYLVNTFLGFKTSLISYSLHPIGSIFVITGILFLFKDHKIRHLLDSVHESTIGFMFFSTVLYIYYLIFELGVPKPAIILPVFSGLMFLTSYLLVLHHESGLLRITYRNIASGLFFMFLADMFLVYYVWVLPIYRIRVVYEILYVLSFLMFSIGLIIFLRQLTKVKILKKKVIKNKTNEKNKKKLNKIKDVKTKVTNKKLTKLKESKKLTTKKPIKKIVKKKVK